MCLAERPAARTVTLLVPILRRCYGDHVFRLIVLQQVDTDTNDEFNIMYARPTPLARYGHE